MSEYGRYEVKFLRWEYDDGTVHIQSYMPELDGEWERISKYFDYHSPNTYIRNKEVNNGNLPYENVKLVYIDFSKDE